MTDERQILKNTIEEFFLKKKTTKHKRESIQFTGKKLRVLSEFFHTS